jgi:DNA-binding response OmpR family regulator
MTPAEDRREATAERRAPGRILVVEDHRDTRDLIAAALASAGYQVDSATSAEAALRELRERRYRLVIAHLGLPGTSGADLLREAWAADLLTGTATLLITGQPDPREAVDFDIIKKPLDLQRFIAEVRALLGELPEPPGSSPAPVPAAEPATVHLILYITPPWASSQKALRNVRRILEAYDPAQVALEVCDLSQDPLRGEADRIVFSPTLVKKRPAPPAWVMGDLSDPHVVADLLLMSGVSPRT